MRVPHTINKNTLKAYEPSGQSLTLNGEEIRNLRSENWQWDESLPKSLIACCIDSVLNDFENQYDILPHLEPYNLDEFLERLSTTLPLDIMMPKVEDGIYWERRCKNTWRSVNDVEHYGFSWKRMFAERFMEDLIENEEPGYTDWHDVQKQVRLCSPYVRRLVITHLEPPRAMESSPVLPDLCTIEDFIPEHLDLSPFLSLLENLEQLFLQFSVRNIGMNFNFKHFRVNDRDVEKLCSGLLQAKRLKTLNIKCSDIDDKKVRLILESLKHSTTLEELSFPHCHIADHGAKALGHYLSVNSNIKECNLENNRIKSLGAYGLCYALTVDSSAHLEVLNLRFNPLGDEGGKSFASCLAKCHFPRRLILASTSLLEGAGIDLAESLRFNSTLQELDISNNALGAHVGPAFIKALESNLTITKIDLRNCELNSEDYNIINSRLHSNREDIRKKKFGIFRWRATKHDDMEKLLRASANLNTSKFDFIK